MLNEDINRKQTDTWEIEDALRQKTGTWAIQQEEVHRQKSGA